MSLRKNFLISLFERYSTLVINFVSSIIIARILSPEEIGLFSVAAGLLTLAHVIRDFGVGNYLIQEKDLTQGKVATVLGLSILISWSIGAIVFITSPYLAAFYGDPEVASVLRLLSINFLIIPFSSAIYPLLRRELEYGKLYNINVTSNLTYALVAILLAYLGYGFMSLAWASLAGVVITFLLAQYYRPAIAIVMPSLREWRTIANFSAINSFTNIVSSLSIQAPELILGKTIGFYSVGIFSRANGIVSMFWNGAVSGVLPVIHTEFARRNREGEDLVEIYRKGVSYITVLAWPGFLYMAVFSESIIVFLYGEKWAAAAPIATLICFSFIFFSLFSMNANVLLALGKVTEHMKFMVGCEVVKIALILYAGTFSLVHVTYALIVSSIVSGVVGSYFVVRNINLRIWNILEPSFKSALVTAGAISTPYLVFFYFDLSVSHFYTLLISGTIFCLSWLLSLYVVRHPFKDELSKIALKLNIGTVT